jgi:hypothetical protein
MKRNPPNPLTRPVDTFVPPACRELRNIGIEFRALTPTTAKVGSARAEVEAEDGPGTYMKICEESFGGLKRL